MYAFRDIDTLFSSNKKLKLASILVKDILNLRNIMNNIQTVTKKIIQSENRTF